MRATSRIALTGTLLRVGCACSANLRLDAPAGSGEDVCQGYCLSQDTCQNIGCCHWNLQDGQCWSSVGQNQCNSLIPTPWARIGQ
eukprot:CAMPEP_0168455648 /NCGR_PEP_ID=MMETSP0228-20121227/50862_1 /TAXON_ID=133427 /ORGANISM="Protoceratium reticulatum, Strain CCCM 535 (=CCMP 1889)" /LENGTH=84 /DNA_ID=CAMNT_0008470507 /DNA_START=91 /DNA_END=342 /DNA_ORIENTATION=+